MFSIMKPTLCVVLGCMAMSLLSKCQTNQPKSDSTPPQLVWNVYNHDTNVQADHNGSPTLQAKFGQRFRIILKANDPEGVKQIQINPSVGSGEITWGCKDPPGGDNLAQSKNATLGPQTQNLSPNSNGNVLTSIFLIQELNFALECPPNWSFTGGTAKLTGDASNYFGGKTTETLTFSITP